MNEKIYLETIEELDECKNNDEILQIVLDLKMQNAEFSKMVESLKQRLAEKDARIEELEGQFAYECECNKQFVECQNELELYKRAFNVATMDLDLCRNHSQTLNDELVERVENLRNTILERIADYAIMGNYGARPIFDFPDKIEV